MTRRIVLIDLYWSRDKDPRTPLGHASLLAALAVRCPTVERCSIVAAVNHLDRQGEDDLLEHVIAQTRTRDARDVDVAIGVYVWAEDQVQRLTHALRVRGFTGRIILGGPQISYAGREIASLYPAADVFVRGYGEDALCQLALTSDRLAIPGVVYRSSLVDSASRVEVDLETLPSPWLEGILGPQSFLRWETQRGCPYRCSFCQHREAGQRLTGRSLASDRVFAEIDLFCRQEVEDIAVLDPVFNSTHRGSPHRAVEILERFASRGFAGRVSLQCRPEGIDERFLDACAALRTRLEFGLQTTQPDEWKAIQRGNNLDRIEQTIAGCHARGIEHEVTLIFGLPGQTSRSFERSVEWCLDRRVPVIKAFPLMLLRGTALELERERWHLRESEGPMPVVISSNTFDEREWSVMAGLSDALRRTEHRHPTTIAELRHLAGDAIDMTRWQPQASF